MKNSRTTVKRRRYYIAFIATVFSFALLIIFALSIEKSVYFDIGTGQRLEVFADKILGMKIYTSANNTRLSLEIARLGITKRPMPLLVSRMPILSKSFTPSSRAGRLQTQYYNLLDALDINDVDDDTRKRILDRCYGHASETMDISGIIKEFLK